MFYNITMNILGFNIKIIYADNEHHTSDWEWHSDDNHWIGFHLWYVYNNKVKIGVEDSTYILTPGDSFIFDLAKNHHCTHNPEKPVEMYSLYFHCDKMETLSHMLDTGQIWRSNHLPTFELNCKLFEEIIKNNNNEYAASIFAAPLFYQLFTYKAKPLSQNEKLTQICMEIEREPQKKYSLDQLAQQAGYSKNQFIRLFKQFTGKTPYEYILDIRINKAKNLLLTSNASITETALALGYNDLNHFSSQFYKKTGMYPSNYISHYKNPKNA